MLNKEPIFVIGFQHGGTNILMNVLMSHPNICMLGAETHRLFYGKNNEPILKWVNRFFYLPIFIGTQQHFFWPSNAEPRNKLPKVLQYYIDLWFYLSKVIAKRNKVRSEFHNNSFKEITQSRLLCKNVNAVALITPMLMEMYPKATFIGFVRNGLAVCEGFVRRGWKVERIGKLYEIVCQQIIEDERKYSNFHIVQFEELIKKPVACIERIYQFSNLNIETNLKFRVQAKRSMNAMGSRNYHFQANKDREIQWFQLEELHKVFREDVNDNQIAQLGEGDKTTFLRYARESMTHFNYI